MESLALSRYALSTITATLILTACGGSQLSVGGSGATPGVGQAARTLLYVSDSGDNFLYVFALPDGRLVGKITGFLGIAGVCSDKKGDVFVVDSQAAEIKEYRHAGNEPIAALSDPDAVPIGCSVDPVTGNLAITNEITTTGSNKTEPGDVVVYKNGKGKPQAYRDPNMVSVCFDSYDGAGNLYVSGVADTYHSSSFAILYKGGSKLIALTLNRILGNCSAIQWDGRYLAVANPDAAQIYRFKINKTRGTKVGGTSLLGASSVIDYWIQGDELYAPVTSNDLPMVGFYPYPRGGRPTRTILGFASAFSATVSNPP